MEYHPYTEIWPLMEGEALLTFCDDIATNGLRLPIITYQGKILDGRNRQLACERTGTKPRYELAPVATDEEALDLVVSLNDHRRHLSIAERAFAASRLATLQRGKYTRKSAKLSSESYASDTTSIRTAAKKIGVSWGSAARARTIHINGTLEDEAEVRSGKTSLNAKAAALTCRKPRPSRATGAPKGRPPRTLVRPAHWGGLRAMTPREVDPEFTGTPTEFVDKYGHVQIATAEEYARMRFTDWALFMRSLAKEARRMPDLGRPVDHNWLRSPKESDVAKLTEALEYLRPKLAEAEALLATAVAQLQKARAAPSVRETHDR